MTGNNKILTNGGDWQSGVVWVCGGAVLMTYPHTHTHTHTHNDNYSAQQN